MPTKGARTATGTAPATNGASRPDYEAPDTLLVAEPEQLRALGDDIRTAILTHLRERAYSTQQLSHLLSMPKGTVGYHLKVLEHAGLVRVVRTRKVRALTEKFYGRTARLFLFQADDPADARAIAGALLRQAAIEVDRAPETIAFGYPKARLLPRDARRFDRRLTKLMDDFAAADARDGALYAFVAAVYRRSDA